MVRGNSSGVAERRNANAVLRNGSAREIASLWLPGSKINQGMRVVLVNILLLIAGLLAVEVIFGDWVGTPRLNKLNLLVDVELRYDAGHLYSSASGEVVYRRDAHGLRGAYGTPETIDILTVGGSTTDQRYITEGATWQDVLRADFSSNGRKLSIANAGVDGQSTYGHIKNFEWWFPFIPNLKPKYLLYYLGTNDLRKDEGGPYDDLRGESVHFSSLKRQLERRSAIFDLYRKAAGIRAARAIQAQHRRVDFQQITWIERPNASNHAAMQRGRLDAYAGRLAILNGMTRNLGAIPIYVTQPTRRCKRSGDKLVGSAETSTFDGTEINGIDYCLMLDALNRRTMDFCRGSGGICIDLAAELEFDDNDFYDYTHNTPAGAAKIGHFLYSRLRGTLDIPVGDTNQR